MTDERVTLNGLFDDILENNIKKILNVNWFRNHCGKQWPWYQDKKVKIYRADVKSHIFKHMIGIENPNAFIDVIKSKAFYQYSHDGSSISNESKDSLIFSQEKKFFTASLSIQTKLKSISVKHNKVIQTENLLIDFQLMLQKNLKLFQKIVTIFQILLSKVSTIILLLIIIQNLRSRIISYQQ